MPSGTFAPPAKLQARPLRRLDVGTGGETGVLPEKYHLRNLCQEVPMMPNIADIIRHHVSLEVRCIDLSLLKTRFGVHGGVTSRSSPAVDGATDHWRDYAARRR